MRGADVRVHVTNVCVHGADARCMQTMLKSVHVADVCVHVADLFVPRADVCVHSADVCACG